MRISYCSSDVCSSDLFLEEPPRTVAKHRVVAVIYLSVVHVGPASINAVEYHRREKTRRRVAPSWRHWVNPRLMRLMGSDPRMGIACGTRSRSEEHTSELQSLMRISYAVFCLQKKKQTKIHN